MKYVLVDNRDNINTSVELGSNVGISGARTYFMGIKKLDLKEFDKLWLNDQRKFDKIKGFI